MRYSSNRSKTENIQTRCCSCGVNVVRNADRQAEVVCLICQAAILNRMFQARRQEAPAETGNGGAFNPPTPVE